MVSYVTYVTYHMVSHGEPPASYHSEPLAEACEQIPPRRQEQTGRNPFHVQKGEMESFWKQDLLVKILRPSKCQLVGRTSMSEKRRWPRTTSSSCRPIVSIICVRGSIFTSMTDVAPWCYRWTDWMELGEWVSGWGMQQFLILWL